MESRDLLLEFWDPLHISGTVKASNVKFGIRIGTGDLTDIMQHKVKRDRDGVT